MHAVNSLPRKMEKTTKADDDAVESLIAAGAEVHRAILKTWKACVVGRHIFSASVLNS
jgi:hypothetical protein